jgi:uncharacterized surface protein with fasciclin (FAS1) repeats
MHRIRFFLIVGLILVLTACGQAASTPQEADPVLAPTQTPETEVEPSPEPTQTMEVVLEPTTTPTTEPTPEPTAITSNAPSEEELADKDYITNVLMADKNLEQFAGELMLGGLFFELDGSYPYTIFAPPFKVEDKPAGLSEDAFKEALKAHLVPGLYVEADLMAMDGQSLDTLSEGNPINISVKDGVVYLNDVAMVTDPDILARNGIIHKIDKFMLQSTE